MNVYLIIELFSVVILIFLLFGLNTKREQSRSSKALSWACWSNLVCSAANALIYIKYDMSSQWQMILLLTCTVITYTVGNLAMLLFTYYDYCYIREQTHINKWLYYVPMGVCIGNLLLSIYSAMSGDVFTTDDGVYMETNGLPVLIFLFYFLIIIYLPIAAFTKVKALGLPKVMMLAAFSTFPLIALIGYAMEMFDYTYASGAISLLAMYIFLDNQLVREKDQRLREEMASHQKELEKAWSKADAANKAKSAFLFNMSHDIRTPMNAITRYAQLMENSIQNPDKCRDYLSKIQKSSDFLLQLINNVLEMARIESGEMHLNEEVHSLSEIEDVTMSIYGNLMAKKNLRFTQEYDIHTDSLLFDIVKVKEIFLNIISNAYKYTPEGGSISVKTVELPSPREGYINIQTVITDTGIGMSKEYLPTIFDDFTREHTATETKVEGTGLGMAIVKKLVVLMGGTIEVESELGHGTSFTITLPLRIATSEDKKVDSGNAVIDYSLFEGKHLLIAEDNDLNAEIAQELLSEVGLVVDRAEDGAKCVSMLDSAAPATYSAILMDIQMPNMNGYEATRQIRALADQTKAQIPIIAMTANAFEEDRQNAFAAGMNAHISKPLEIPVLLHTLSQYIG